jgi:hypothetical protein
MDVITVLKYIGLAILIVTVYNMWHNRGGGCTWAH